MAGTESQKDNKTESLFAGLDSFLTSSAKESGSLEVDTTTGIIENPVKDQIISKKAEENKLRVEDDSDKIEVDVDTPSSTKSVSEFSNKEIKDDTTPLIVNEVDDTEENGQSAEAEALKSFVSILKENDVLSGLDLNTYDGSIDGLKQAVYNEARGIADEYKETLPPVIKYLIDNYEENVPLDQLINIKSNEIRYSSIDTEKLEEDTGLQKEVYKEFLKKTTNFSDAKIAKEVTRLEETGELSSETAEALPELIKFEKKKEQQLVAETKAVKEEEQRKNKETLATIKKTADGFKGKEIVPGLKLTDKDVLALNKSLTTPVGYDNNGTPISEIQKMRAEDPIGFELRLNYLAKLTKGFTDYSEIMKKAKTVVAKEVEKAADSTSTYKGGKANIVETTKSKDIMSAFSKFQKARQK